MFAATSIRKSGPELFRPGCGLHETCPLDGCTAQARAVQITRFGGYNGQLRTAAPNCGQVMQDVPGTAQGNWFTESFGDHANWDQEMALVHGQLDPTLAAISIGGTVMEMGVWLFPPENAGLVNRESSQVKPDGRIYYYQGALSFHSGQETPEFPGILMIRMASEVCISVEGQECTCQIGWGFTGQVECASKPSSMLCNAAGRRCLT